jgi:predicted amidohydrolase YtcJ
MLTWDPTVAGLDPAARQVVVTARTVRTGDPDAPEAEAVAFTGDRVHAVGTRREVIAACPAGTTVIELPDATVLPGLTDAHHHACWTGLKLLRLFGEGDHDPADALAALEADEFTLPWPDGEPTPEQRVMGLRLAQRLLHALGITGVIDPAVKAGELAAYRALHAAGELSLRVVAMPHVELDAGIEPALAGLDALDRAGDERLRLGPAKVYVDGQGRAATALLREPWPGRADRGTQYIPGDVLQRFAVALARRGWALGAHVVGGGAIDAALAAYAAADAVAPIGAGRWQLIHAYLWPSAENLAEAARLGVVASVQPSIQLRNGAALVRLLGDAAADAAPLRAWVDAGVTTAGGSDGPDFPFDPRVGMWQARTRRVDGLGEPVGPAQALDGAAALGLWTTGAAGAAYAAGTRGVLRPGALADWTAWSVDPVTAPPEALPGAAVLMTVVGGAVVHDARMAA